MQRTTNVMKLIICLLVAVASIRKKVRVGISGLSGINPAATAIAAATAATTTYPTSARTTMSTNTTTPAALPLLPLLVTSARRGHLLLFLLLLARGQHYPDNDRDDDYQ